MGWSAGLKTQRKDFQQHQTSVPASRRHNCFSKVCALMRQQQQTAKQGSKPAIPSFESCHHSVYGNNTESLNDKQDPCWQLKRSHRKGFIDLRTQTSSSDPSMGKERQLCVVASKWCLVHRQIWERKGKLWILTNHCQGPSPKCPSSREMLVSYTLQSLEGLTLFLTYVVLLNCCFLREK